MKFYMKQKMDLSKSIEDTLSSLEWRLKFILKQLFLSTFFSFSVG